MKGLSIVLAGIELLLAVYCGAVLAPHGMAVAGIAGFIISWFLVVLALAASGSILYFGFSK